MKQATKLYRLFFGLLILVAITAQFVYKQPQNINSLVDFFSYFTILSNLLAAVVFLCLATGRKTFLGVTIEALRPAVVVYMVITGIVVLVLLEKYSSLALMLPWAGDVLHKITPIVFFADWLLHPPKKNIKYAAVFYWLIFPLVFVVYSLLRGPWVGNWYPYPFLDPNDVNGYWGVCKYVALIYIGAFVIAQLVIFSGNRLRKNE